MRKTNARIAIVSAVAGLLVATAAQAASPWGLYGTASSVKTGTGANPWAIQISSATTAGDFSTLTYGGAFFVPPSGGLLFSQLYQISADYDLLTGSFGGGAPRFSVGIDVNGDGVADGNVFIYLGTPPSFNDSPVGWQNTGNLLAATDSRFDTSQVGGTFYDTYSDALTLVGSLNVVYVSLDVDGGWLAPYDQVLDVDNVTVNNFVLSARGFSKKTN